MMCNTGAQASAVIWKASGQPIPLLLQELATATIKSKAKTLAIFFIKLFFKKQEIKSLE